MDIPPCMLVTGANGFLGSEIARQGMINNLPIRETDKNGASIKPQRDYQPADILDIPRIKSALRGINCVIHAAGLAHVFNPVKTQTGLFEVINVKGTENIARAAAEAAVRHFVLISSVSVYGPGAHKIFSEDTSCCPVGPYAESKHHAELRAMEIARNSGMALTILRLATIYGEGDPGNVNRLMRVLDRGRFIWIGDGSNQKSLIYKGDAARACLAVASRPANGVRIYNVAAPPCTMREIADSLAMALGKKPLPVRIPAHVALATGKFLSCFPAKRFSGLHSTIEKWLAEDVYDTSRFERDYGFHTHVNLIEGLKREVRWYRQSKGNTCQ